MTSDPPTDDRAENQNEKEDDPTTDGDPMPPVPPDDSDQDDGILSPGAPPYILPALYEDMGKDEKKAAKSPLRHLHDTQASVEKIRVAIGNRVFAITHGEDEVTLPTPKVYEDVLVIMDTLEATIDRGIAAELKKWPVYEAWLSRIKGIGPSLAGQVLALLHTPRPDKGPSSWYKGAGLVPELQEDGTMRLPRPRKGGGKIEYHPYLRRCLFNVGTSFVRNGGYYRDVYDRAKRTLFQMHAWEAEKFLSTWESTGSEARPALLRHLVEDDEKIVALSKLSQVNSLLPIDEQIEKLAMTPSMFKAFTLVGGSDETWPMIRIDRVARWISVKLFLSHLWEAWSEAENIPVRDVVPYAIEHLGHVTYIPRPKPGKGENV